MSILTCGIRKEQSEMNRLIKVISSLMIASMMALGVSGADTKKVNKYHVTFLDNYSQLSLNNGVDGIYFVKNAASSNALDHNGDPTVKTGWAVYIWDSRISVNNGIARGGWVKIAESESLDSSAAEMALRYYVRNETLNQKLEELADVYLTREEYEQHDPAEGLVRRVTNLETLTSGQSRDIATNTGNISLNSSNIARLQQQINEIISQGSIVGKQYIDEQDAATLEAAKAFSRDYTVTVVSNFTEFAIGVVSNFIMTAKEEYDEKIKYLKVNDTHVLVGPQAIDSVDYSTVVGYAITARDPNSTVVGHGDRKVGELLFVNEEVMTNFLRKAECKSRIFATMGISIGDIHDGCEYGIKRVLNSPDPVTGMYAELEVGPLDYLAGLRSWRFGKSHGEGTFNIVALGQNGENFQAGLEAVYINDRSLSELIGVHHGEPITLTNYVVNASGQVVEEIKTVEDYSLRIGENTRVLGNDGTHTQSISIGRDAITASSAAVAVGPNTEVWDKFGIALGWRAASVGEHGIAIGSGKASNDYWLSTDPATGRPIPPRTKHNPNEYLCLAEAKDSISVGFQARVTSNAVNSVQLGTGVNDKPNTLKFRDVTIVEDGKVIADYDPNVLDPTLTDVGTTEKMVCRAHTINTMEAPSADRVDQVELFPESSRNYEVFIPNDVAFRKNLPLTIKNGVPEVTTVLFEEGAETLDKLPVLAKVRQPRRDTLIFNIKDLDDGTDWTPVINRINVYFDHNKGLVHYGESTFRGTSLHSVKECKLRYPISATETFITNLVFAAKEANEDMGPISLYDKVVLDYMPPPDKPFYFENDRCDIEFLNYYTSNGEAHFNCSRTVTLGPGSDTLFHLSGNVAWVDDTPGKFTGRGHYELTRGDKYIILPSEITFSYPITNGTTVVSNLSDAIRESDKYVVPVDNLLVLDEGTTNILTFTTVGNFATNVLKHVTFKSDISSATLKIPADYPLYYDGSAKKPPVTITLRGADLDTNDFVVVYFNNVNVGTATIKATPTSTSGYSGSISGSFKIVYETVPYMLRTGNTSAAYAYEDFTTYAALYAVAATNRAANIRAWYAQNVPYVTSGGKKVPRPGVSISWKEIDPTPTPDPTPAPSRKFTTPYLLRVQSYLNETVIDTFYKTADTQTQLINTRDSYTTDPTKLLVYAVDVLVSTNVYGTCEGPVNQATTTWLSFE